MEPDLEVEGGAGVAGGTEQAEGDAAVDAAAEEDGDPEPPARRGAGEVGVQVAAGGGSRGIGEPGGAGERGGGEWLEEGGPGDERGGGEGAGSAEGGENGGRRRSGEEEGWEDEWSRDQSQHRRHWCSGRCEEGGFAGVLGFCSRPEGRRRKKKDKAFASFFFFPHSKVRIFVIFFSPQN